MPNSIRNTPLFNDSALVLLWEMEGNANDSSPSGRNGTTTGITFGESYGKFNQGANGGGSNSLITTSFSWLPTDFSVSFWIKTSSLTNYNNQVGCTSGWGTFIFHVDSNGGIYVGTDLTTRFTPTELPGAVVNGEWIHFVYTYQSSTGLGRFYKNGVRMGAKANNAPSTWGGFYVGGNGSGAALAGNIDDVAVFSRTLDYQEVVRLYGENRPNEIKQTPVYNDSSLLSLWRMEDNTNDDFGRYNGTATDITYVTDPTTWGKCAYFNGTSSLITLPSGLSDFSKGFTACFWAKPTAVQAWARFFDWGTASGTGNYNLLMGRNSTTNDMYLWSGNGTAFNNIYIQNGLVNNEWHFYCATIDIHGVGRVYRDGRIIGSGTLPLPQVTTRGTNYIGKSNWAGDSLYKGYLDDMAIFTRSLSHREILDIYKGTYPKYTQDQLSKYRHDRFVGFTPLNRRIENTPLFNDANLWGYWKLDGNSLDSKSANNGTDTAMTYPEESSQFGKPACFNGSTSHIQVGSLSHRTNDFTYSFWAKWRNMNTFPSVQTYVENGWWANSMIIRQEASHYINIWAMGSSIGSLLFAPTAGQWYHLALVKSGSTMYLYVNGRMTGSIAFTADVQPSAYMWFGASQHSSTQCMNGYLADMAIFTRALTANEVYQIYNGFTIPNNLKDKKRLENNTINTPYEVGELLSPLDIYGCKLWIDISGLTNVSGGTQLSSIPDFSGNGNTLAQRSAGQNPYYYQAIKNNLPVMRGTASASTTWDIPWTYAVPNTIFYIGKRGASGRVISGKSNNFLLGWWSSYRRQFYAEGWVGANSDVGEDYNYHVYTAIINSNTTPSGYSTLLEDGSVVKFGNGGLTAPSGLTIGYTGTSEFSDHDIGEIIGYNRALNDNERARVENYLLKKWGMDYNLALDKPAYLSWTGAWHWYPTDGSSWTDYYVGVNGSAYVLVDLLDVYTVNRVDIFHYWWDGRTYYYNKVETSPDGIVWTTRFDSEVNGRYAETYAGKTITFTGAPVRYVRHTLNGSSANTGSHFNEIRVVGK